MAININVLLTDIEALLEPNSAGVKVFREEYTPDKSADRKNGWISWDWTTDFIDQCSEEHSGIIGGDLEVMMYATKREQRGILQESVLDILSPRKTPGDPSTKRDSLGPVQLQQMLDDGGGGLVLTDTSFLHFCRFESQIELFGTKTGHGLPDVPGTSYTFQLKVN